MRPRPRAPRPTNKMTRSGPGRPAVTSGASFRPPTSQLSIRTSLGRYDDSGAVRRRRRHQLDAETRLQAPPSARRRRARRPVARRVRFSAAGGRARRPGGSRQCHPSWALAVQLRVPGQRPRGGGRPSDSERDAKMMRINATTRGIGIGALAASARGPGEAVLSLRLRLALDLVRLPHSDRLPLAAGSRFQVRLLQEQ
jgi:hypothetical protein